ncbi:hypothetical protein C8F01DRAFT_1119075 [Mycena amicta]|nr:hypothetical protein C8F01DRAFT_1119075 [Mycena amicta]
MQNDTDPSELELGTLGISLSSIARKTSARARPQTAQLAQRMEPLSSLAIIAVFLAGVQAQAISFSLNQNATRVEIVTNAFAFAGLFLDVLGGSWALVGLIQLQHSQALLNERKLAISNLRETIKLALTGMNDSKQLTLLNHLHLLEKVIFPPIYHPQLWTEMSDPLRNSALTMEKILRTLDESFQISAAFSLEDYRNSTEALMAASARTSLGLTASVAVPLIVIAGLCCFALGALCLAVSSQPVEVWATSIAVVGVTLLLFAIVFLVTRNGVALRSLVARRHRF